jgi:hypothetical protein
MRVTSSRITVFQFLFGELWSGTLPRQLRLEQKVSLSGSVTVRGGNHLSKETRCEKHFLMLTTLLWCLGASGRNSHDRREAL